jgi:SNF2 family DNA or RNA helicase
VDELRYRPNKSDLRQFLEAHPVAELLILGTDLPEEIENVASIRMVSNPLVLLPTGFFVFQLRGVVQVLSVDTGSSPGGDTSCTWNADDDHPLINAYGWYEELWPDAQQIDRPKFEVGDDVLVTAGRQEGMIRKREFHEGRWVYQVRADGKTQQFFEQALMEIDVDDDPEEWVKRPPVDPGRLIATLTRTKLNEDLTDTVYSFRASRTVFRPYQFRPVMRLLESEHQRLLIADEVGLGKTIEAGLIWTELDARRQANRVLIVAPSMLVPKWRNEMIERFNYELDELTNEALQDMLLKLEEDRLPARFHAVVSLERMRVWSGLERLVEIAPRFDLVVVDEAHAFRNSVTKSHELGEVLSDLADTLIFLSATPLNLGNDDLYTLMELLVPGEFDNKEVFYSRLEPNAILNGIALRIGDTSITPAQRLNELQKVKELAFGEALEKRSEFRVLEKLLGKKKLTATEFVEVRRSVKALNALANVITRTRKAEVIEKKAIREAIDVHVPWTREEADFYALFEAYQIQKAIENGVPSGFATQMPLRVASSCLPVVRDRILNGMHDDWQIELDEFDELESPINADVELVHSQSLRAAAEKIRLVDTKFDLFAKQLKELVDAQKRVIVFTFSRETLNYLANRLSGDIRFRVMHGDVQPSDRHVIMRDFRDGKFDVLFASKVASEGLDFEFCSAVVNYDLPWNPMEIEQRIGRIDRFGQTEERIFVVNFHTPGTIETEIFLRVHARIRVFQESIGELEPILSNKLVEISRIVFDFSLSLEERQKKIDQVLIAAEEERFNLEQIENSSGLLASIDTAEIEGLEKGLVDSGRYVGQEELVHLLSDWAYNFPGSKLETSADGKWLFFQGTAGMADSLEKLTVLGDRSRRELEDFARKMRQEQSINICLDQELARISSSDLLTANHVLVRAAVSAATLMPARFGHLSIKSENLPSGKYLVLISHARWKGLRAKSELWTTSINLENSDVDFEVGSAMLASLARGDLSLTAKVHGVDSFSAPLRNALLAVTSKQLYEESEMMAENDAIIEVRKVNIEETFKRKIRLIDSRIESAKANGKDVAVRLNESQLRNQERLLKNALEELEQARTASLNIQHIAVSILEVN